MDILEYIFGSVTVFTGQFSVQWSKICPEDSIESSMTVSLISANPVPHVTNEAVSWYQVLSQVASTLDYRCWHSVLTSLSSLLVEQHENLAPSYNFICGIHWLYTLQVSYPGIYHCNMCTLDETPRTVWLASLVKEAWNGLIDKWWSNITNMV